MLAKVSGVRSPGPGVVSCGLGLSTKVRSKQDLREERGRPRGPGEPSGQRMTGGEWPRLDRAGVQEGRGDPPPRAWKGASGILPRLPAHTVALPGSLSSPQCGHSDRAEEEDGLQVLPLVLGERLSGAHVSAALTLHVGLGQGYGLGDL